MKFLNKIFSFSKEKETAHVLYRIVVEQARRPVYYTNMNVADTFDGRFDMIALHMILLMRRLKMDVDVTRKLSQALFDYMFDDMDLNLRELGFGDMGVLKRVKKMAKAFYGRLDAYDAALTAQDTDALKEALDRNLYRDNVPTEKNLEDMATYMRRESDRLVGIPIEELVTGKLTFGEPPEDTGEKG